jgi:hypothetical protein
MKPLSLDTTPEAQRIHFELMRPVPGWKRLTLALELTQATRALIVADLRERFPNATDEEIRRRFIVRVLSREEVAQVYGFDSSET